MTGLTAVKATMPSRALREMALFGVRAYLEAALLRTARTISPEQREYLYALAEHHSAPYALILETTSDESIPLRPGRDEDRSFRREAGVQISEALTALKLRSLDPDSAAATARIVEFLDGIDAKRMVKAD